MLLDQVGEAPAAPPLQPADRGTRRHLLRDLHLRFDRAAQRRAHRAPQRGQFRAFADAPSINLTADERDLSGLFARLRRLGRGNLGRASRSAARWWFRSNDIARSAFDAADFINARNITYFSTVPSFLSMITEELPTVRLLVLGGDVLPGRAGAALGVALSGACSIPMDRPRRRWSPPRPIARADKPVTIGKALAGLRHLSCSTKQLQPGARPANAANSISAAPASRAAISTGPN